MTTAFLKILFLLILMFAGILNSHSQSIEAKINAIDITIKINKTKDSLKKYQVINTDGFVFSNKKFLGIFKRTKNTGGFSETYTVKDSLLIDVIQHVRIFLNKEMTLSTIKTENFIYKHEKLCYYLEKKSYINDSKADSLIYEIEYYIENETILKTTTKGVFNQSLSEYLTQIIENSKSKIVSKKNFLNRRIL